MWISEALDWERLWQRLVAEGKYYAPKYNLYFDPPKPENCVQVWIDKQEYRKIKKVLLFWSYR